MRFSSEDAESLAFPIPSPTQRTLWVKTDSRPRCAGNCIRAQVTSGTKAATLWLSSLPDNLILLEAEVVRQFQFHGYELTLCWPLVRD